MAAVDNKHMIEVLTTKVEEGISKKTGMPWVMRKVQCIVRGPDNSLVVGVLSLPRGFEDVVPGKYLAEFELGIDFDNKVIPLLVKLHPFGETAKPVAKA